MPGLRAALLPRRHRGNSSQFERLCCRTTRISTPTLRSIRLHFADPVAQSLQGEIAPFQVDQLGVERVFSLYVQPHFERLDPGFDELLLTAPTNMALRLGGVFGGRADEFNVETDAVPALEQVEVVPTAPDSLPSALCPRWPRQRDRDSAARFYRGSLCHGGPSCRRLCATALRLTGALGSGLTPAMWLAHIPGNTTTVVSAFESPSSAHRGGSSPRGVFAQWGRDQRPDVFPFQSSESGRR